MKKSVQLGRQWPAVQWDRGQSLTPTSSIWLFDLGSLFNLPNLSFFTYKKQTNVLTSPQLGQWAPWRIMLKPGVAVYLSIQSHCEFQDSLSYKAKPCPRKKNNNPSNLEAGTIGSLWIQSQLPLLKCVPGQPGLQSEQKSHINISCLLCAAHMIRSKVNPFASQHTIPSKCCAISVLQVTGTDKQSLDCQWLYSESREDPSQAVWLQVPTLSYPRDLISLDLPRPRPLMRQTHDCQK